MIKNIVFDMGNVLVAYDGRKVCKRYIKDKKDRKRVFTAIFQSPEWQDCVCGIGISII